MLGIPQSEENADEEGLFSPSWSLDELVEDIAEDGVNFREKEFRSLHSEHMVEV